MLELWFGLRYLGHMIVRLCLLHVGRSAVRKLLSDVQEAKLIIQET